jgi:hypothetical protein
VTARLLPLLLAALLVAIPAAPAASPVGEVAPAAKKKPKKCKKGQVAFILKGKRSCRSLKKAIPRPKKGNSKLIYAQAALDADLHGVRDRRGRKAPSIEKAMRRISPRAAGRLDAVLKRGIALLDRAKARAAQGGGSVGFTYDLGNGASFDVRADLVRANLEVSLTGRQNGQRVRTRIGIKQDLGFRGPLCPTAQGVLEARDGLRLAITVEFLDDDGSVDYYYTQVIFQTTKLRGTVRTDAKLDKLKVEDKLELGEMTGGLIFGNVNIQSEVKRETTVDMRTGNYDPGHSRVQVSVALSGILRLFQSSAQAGATARIQAAADRGFAATVDRAIENYRQREAGWQTPNTCAKLEFSPASNSRTLRPSGAGSFTAKAIATEGGGAAELDAQLTNPVNAIFSPSRATGQQAGFQYTVFPVPSGPKVRAAIRATSKAGVAADTWEQNVQPPFGIDRIAGNFSGSHSQPAPGGRTARITWTGGATFTRSTPPAFAGAFGSYPLTAGHATYHFSGGNILQHAVCDMRGSADVDLFQRGGGALGVTPVDSVNIFAQGPHDYGGNAAIGPEATVTLTMENCIPQAASEEGKQYTIPIGQPPLDTGQESLRSPDGIHYDGSYSRSEGGVTYEWSWTLLGDKASP